MRKDGIERNARLEQPLQFGDVIALRHLCSQFGPIAVGLVIMRVEREHAIVVGFRLGKLPQETSYRRAIENELRIARRRSHGLLVRRQRALLVTGSRVEPEPSPPK